MASRQAASAQWLSSPKVGAENFVPNALRGHSPLEQGGANQPHKGQGPAGEDLHTVWQRNLRQVHVTLTGTLLGSIHVLVPRIGREVVDLSANVPDGLAQGVVVGRAVGVGKSDRALRLGSGDVLHDR